MGNSLEQALKRCDFRRVRALPSFCAVGRLSALFNALSACWKMLSIRRHRAFIQDISLKTVFLCDLYL